MQLTNACKISQEVSLALEVILGGDFRQVLPSSPTISSVRYLPKKITSLPIIQTTPTNTEHVHPSRWAWVCKMAHSAWQWYAKVWHWYRSCWYCRDTCTSIMHNVRFTYEEVYSNAKHCCSSLRSSTSSSPIYSPWGRGRPRIAQLDPFSCSSLSMSLRASLTINSFEWFLAESSIIASVWVIQSCIRELTACTDCDTHAPKLFKHLKWRSFCQR